MRKGKVYCRTWAGRKNRRESGQPRSSSGVPALGAAVYGRKDGVEMLAKAWHSKTLACSFQLMKSGRVKLSIWQLNKRFRQDHQQKMKRLRALLCESEIGVSAQSPVPSGLGVQEITCGLATPEKEARMSSEERAQHEDERLEFYGVD